MKFIRRHRRSVAVTAALVLAVSTGVVATAWQSHQRAIEARKAEAVTDFVLNLFSGIDPARARGGELTAQEIVEEGVRRIGSEFKNQPLVRAEILRFLAELYGKLGQRETALTLVGESLTLRATPHTLVVQGGLLIESGELDRGIAAIERALPALRDEHALRAEAWDQLAIANRQRGELPESLRLSLRALELREATLGADHVLVAQSLNNLGVLSREAGDFPASAAYHGRALEIRRRILPENHPEIGISLNNLGALAVAQSDYASAEQYLGDALALNRAVHGDDHPLTIAATNNIGSVYRRQDRFAEARVAFEHVLAYWLAGPGEMHPNALITRHNLAMVAAGEGQLATAADMFERLLVDAPRVFGPQHALVPAVLHGYAAVLVQQHELPRALELHRRALEVRRASRSERDPELAESMHDTAVVELALGNAEEARRLLDAALAIQQEVLPADHPSLARTRAAHAALPDPRP